jgi:hypothetical protein
MRGYESGRLESMPLTKSLNLNMPLTGRRGFMLTALVCGQLGVLTMTERWIQQHNFDPPPQVELEPKLISTTA